MLQTAQEAVRALDVPVHREWALSTHFNVVVKCFQVRCLIIKTLVLSEFVLESDREVVDFSLLVEYHFEVQFVDFASLVEQVHYLVLTRFLRV